MNLKGLLTGLAIAGLLLGPADALAMEHKVDCDKGQSIQKVFDDAPTADREVNVIVTGDCYEDVRIANNRFSIAGDGAATIHGRVAILGLRGRLSNLTVDGQVRILGAIAGLTDVHITGPGPGLFQSTGRTRLRNVHISGNQGPGVDLGGNGVLFFISGTVESNDGDGIYVESASVTVGSVEIFGNHSGVNALISKVTLDNGASIHDNGNHGVDGNFHSSILMWDGVEVYGNGGSGIRLEDDSGLVAFDPVSMYDNGGNNVFCADTESSAKFHSGAPDFVSCTGFNQAATHTVMPTVTFESGSGTHPAGTTMMGDDAYYTSDTSDPLGPFFGQSVHFLGTDAGGQPQIYRYRLDFDDDVQLNSIVISGAAWWGGPFGTIRVLDADQNELVNMQVPLPLPPLGSNAYQDVMVNLSGVIGSTFYLEEYNIDSYWRYRSNIVVNAY